MVILNAEYFVIATVFIPMMFMIPVLLFNAINHLSECEVTEEEVWSNILVSSDDDIQDYPFRAGE